MWIIRVSKELSEDSYDLLDEYEIQLRGGGFQL